jgi:hypothetical protein
MSWNFSRNFIESQKNKELYKSGDDDEGSGPEDGENDAEPWGRGTWED